MQAEREMITVAKIIMTITTMIITVMTTTVMVLITMRSVNHCNQDTIRLIVGLSRQTATSRNTATRLIKLLGRVVWH